MTGTTDPPGSQDEQHRVSTRLGRDAQVDPSAVVGYRYGDAAGPTVLGDGARVRAHTVVYGDVAAGDRFVTGHGALVREQTTVGDDVLVGTGAVLDGAVDVGDGVSVQSQVYLPPGTVVGDRAFLGPAATLTNDPYPTRQDVELAGPTLGDDATVGANATVLPGVTVGERAFVAAGAVVVDDVPPDTLAVGAPAEHRPLPPALEGGNAGR